MLGDIMKTHYLAPALMALAVGYSGVTHAEHSGFSVTPGIGLINFDSKRLDADLDDAVLGSLGIGYKFNSPWQWELVYAVGETENETTSTDIDYQSLHLDALYHFNEDSSINPYLAIGVGHVEFDVDGASSNIEESDINFGGGIKWTFNDLLALRTDVRGFDSFDDEDLDVVYTLGLQFLFGGSSSSHSHSEASEPVRIAPQPIADVAESDSDGDGVADSADRCRATPRGVQVDARGCALDDDGDRVANHLDNCPDSEAGAKVDASGCYIVLAETREIELEVKFANNSDVVPPAYYDEISAVANFLRQYPNTAVVIEGHTDSGGAASYNQDLSERRAANVASVLTKKLGVSSGRVSSVGYGEAKPIATNDTAQGKAANRRVVAVVSTVVEKRAQ